MKWNSPIFDEIRGTLKTTNTTFRMWKGRRIAEKKPVPRQPNTFTQVYQRALYKMALESWKSLSPDEKEFWKTEAGKIGLDGHNLYIRQYITDFGRPVSAWLLEEGAGTIVYDRHGGINGNVDNCTWEKLPSGKFCLNFNGTSGTITFRDCYDFDGRKPHSIVIWVYIDDQLADYPGILSKHGVYGGYRNGWAVVFDRTAQSISVERWRDEIQEKIFAPIQTHQFKLITVAYDGTNLKLFIDGKLHNVSESTLEQLDTTITLKAGYLGLDNHYFKGKIAFIAIYERDLTLEEHRAFYNLTKPFFS